MMYLHPYYNVKHPNSKILTGISDDFFLIDFYCRSRFRKAGLQALKSSFLRKQKLIKLILITSKHP